VSVEGNVRCCRQCSQVIRRKEEVLQFQQKLRECEEYPLKLLYDSIASMKGTIDSALKRYFDLISSVDIMDGFEVVDELDDPWSNQRGSTAEEEDDEDLVKRDDVAIEWNDGDSDDDHDDDEDETKKKKTRNNKHKKNKVKAKAKAKKESVEEDDDEMRHLTAEQIIVPLNLRLCMLASACANHYWWPLRLRRSRNETS
jgi:hypothetical protein